MSVFRRVEGREAGPAALGVLAPPGRRTYLILRPRSLPWDLVLLRPADASVFREMDRDEAIATAEELVRALEAWSDGAPGRVESASAARGSGFWLHVHAGLFSLLLCRRTPGRPYEAERFADDDAARAAAADLTPILRPPPGAQQELYFNTRHFGR
ncbi:MAG TPA: hypothetical protein DDY78_03155 [Planctomycetales bacterium]|jgi:hypothetical protein|nr:hypothetical protein [Planctomycetales bacterium]